MRKLGDCNVKFVIIKSAFLSKRGSIVKKLFQLILAVVLLSTLSYTKQPKPHLLFYCGVTMSKAMRKIADIVEKRENCVIKMISDPSQDLYNALKYSKIGDLYLPGSDVFISSNKKDGFFGRSVFVGYNQAAIIVPKGNPKHIKTLNDLLDKNVSVVVCDPHSGSIGKNTKKLLTLYGGKEFDDKIYQKSIHIAIDSKDINRYLRKKEADASINWIGAIKSCSKTKPLVDIIPIDEKYAHKKKLMLTILKFSKHKDIANKFLDFAISKDGQRIMHQYGF